MNLKSKKILVIGASSGIGRALVKELIKQKAEVFGIARREKLLKSLQYEISSKQKFFFKSIDIAKKNSWNEILTLLKRKKFDPDIVVFAAAIQLKDYENTVNVELNRQMFETNYFSVMEGIRSITQFTKKRVLFVAISSLTALKGSGEGGIGYSASKAALSVSFESLYLKYHKRYDFKIVYFGPVNSGMSPFKKGRLFRISELNAVSTIINAINSKKVYYFVPLPLFLSVLWAKSSSVLYFKLLKSIDFFHRKYKKNEIPNK